jgi:hypothetical protein
VRNLLLHGNAPCYGSTTSLSDWMVAPAMLDARMRTVHVRAVPAAGTPETVAVPSPRSRNVSPVGNGSSAVNEATGVAVVLMVKLVDRPTRVVRLDVLVNTGRVARVKVNACVAVPALFRAVTVSR